MFIGTANLCTELFIIVYLSEIILLESQRNIVFQSFIQFAIWMADDLPKNGIQAVVVTYGKRENFVQQLISPECYWYTLSVYA